MKRKFSALLLSLAMIVAMLFSTQFCFAEKNEERIPISSCSDILKIEDNLSGDYYLANDIEINTHLSIQNFQGTFDGCNHSITFSRPEYIESLFDSAKNATIKNISFPNIKKSTGNGSFSLVVIFAENCTIENIYASGDVCFSGHSVENNWGIVAGYIGNGTIKNCINDVNMTYITDNQMGGSRVGGVVGVLNGGSISDCVNNGDITIDVIDEKKERPEPIANYYLGGVVGHGFGLINNCKNYGEIVGHLCSDTKYAFVGGVVGKCFEIKRCSNYGKVTYTAEGTGELETYAGGVFGISGAKAELCFNVSKLITNVNNAKILSSGGVCGYTNNLINCYNTGDIQLTGNNKKTYVAGVAGSTKNSVSNTYTCGKITVSGINISKAISCVKTSKNNKGSGNYYTSKANIKNTNSNSCFGTKLVSKIDLKKCSKLSSKVWKYSSKKARLLLRKNLES